MKAVATLGSMHVCPMCSGNTAHVGGPVTSGQSGVTINDMAVAAMGDSCICTGMGVPDKIVQGQSGVTINGKPVVVVSCKTAHGGSITSGAPGVTISSNTPDDFEILPLHRIPFPEISTVDRWKALLYQKSLKPAEIAQEEIKNLATETEIEEDSKEVTLETTFAMDQLQVIAKIDSLAVFMKVFIEMFGDDIPAKAYQELYEDAQVKASILTATLKVKKNVPGGKAVFYDDMKEMQEIWVSEQVIRDAEKDNELRGELMTILVEEYGHYLDYLLRNHYAQSEKKDALGDEGAKFTYNVFTINPIEDSDQHFADATIDGRSVKLIWDFSEIHNNLKKYVSEARQNREDKVGNFEFYKAGFLEPHGQFGHGDIEQEALNDVFSQILGSSQAKQSMSVVYLGNWLRDFSQIVDPMTVRPLAYNAAIMAANSTGDTSTSEGLTNTVYGDENDYPRTELTEHSEMDIKLPSGYDVLSLKPTYEIKQFHPVMFSVEGFTTIVEMAACKEFIHTDTHEKIADYNDYLKELRENYIEITPDTLGPYRPEEHIDNPKGLGHNEHGGDRGDFQLYNKFIGYVSDDHQMHKINKSFGMKNYIRSDKSYTVHGVKSRTSYEYILDELTIAGKLNGIYDTELLTHFGAALHTLEDYFAHTNFSEISLIKNVEAFVFPWVDNIKQTGFKYDYSMLSQGKGLDDKYAVLDDMNRIKPSYSEINKIASYIPVVTGTFGMVDTAASILPIMNENLFSIEIEPWTESEPGERTFNDVLILELLKDIDSTTDSNIYATGFEDLLWVRDGFASIKQIVPDIIKQGFHWITERIGVIFNFSIYFSLKAIAASLNDAQVLINKDLEAMSKDTYTFQIGIDPSHTQIAKDDVHHPLHELSALLAVEAVKQVAEKMAKVWTGSGHIKSVHEVVDKIMRHPVECNWQDEIVKKWAANPNNKAKICKASTPSVIIEGVMHALHEMEESLEAMQTYLSGNTVMDKMASYFENNTEVDIDVKGLKDMISKSVRVCEEQHQKADLIRERWESKFPKPYNCRNFTEQYTYRVKPNESLSHIAVKGNTTVELLKMINNLTSDMIVPDQILKVPNQIAEYGNPH